MRRPSVLVVDDERLIRWSIAAELEERGYDTREAETGEQARAEVERGVDAIVLDQELPGTDAFELLRELRARAPDIPVIVLTPEGDGAQASEAGAQALSKPFEPRQVGLAIEGACRRDRDEAGREAEEEGRTAALSRLRGQSQALQELKDALVRVSTSPARAILISGEAGSGRHLAARLLHEISDRAEQPFRHLSGTRASREVLESVLAEAVGGTVVLEGIDGLSVDVQEGLMRFLESPSDTRVVVVAGPDLSLALARGALRHDLHEMLSGTRVQVPGLRDRRGDVAQLTRYFVHKLAHLLETEARDVDDAALALLERHTWPGNVRELRDTLERAMVLSDRPTLEERDFVLLMNGVDPASVYSLPPGGLDLKELERNLVIQALERTHGNRTRAAELLRMTRDQMRYRVAKFGLDGA